MIAIPGKDITSNNDKKILINNRIVSEEDLEKTYGEHLVIDPEIYRYIVSRFECVKKKNKISVCKQIMEDLENMRF